MEDRQETAPLLALAERAERLGFDSIWVGDSVLARPRHDAITLLGAVAGRTRRVALGTAVLLPALRNPVLLAHQVATLDQVSDGRVILGIAAGWLDAEFDAVGVPYAERGARTDEAIEIGVDLPGVDADAVRVVVKGNAVLIAGEKAAQSQTVTGCLQKADASGEFSITGEDGKTWELRSTTVKLDQHLGHKVTVTGSTTHESAKTEKAEEKKEGQVENAGTKEEFADITVTSLKMVSDSCAK